MTRTEYAILIKKWYRTHTGDYNYIWTEYSGFRYLDKEEAEKDLYILIRAGVEVMLKEVLVDV